jgi:hypothetical protein
MDLLKPFRKVIKKVADTLADRQSDQELMAKLKYWDEKLKSALSKANNYPETLFNDREMIYNGTIDVDYDPDTRSKSGKLSKNVVNIVYEFLESEVDNTVPAPTVKSRHRGFEYLAQMIEDSAKDDIKVIPDFGEMLDENERTTTIQGFSLFEIMWNPDVKHHLWRGELQVKNPHPKAFIPQPGVYRIKDMDYFFIMFSVTKRYVERRYNVDIGPGDSDEYPQMNAFHGTQNWPGKVTLVECWYKDTDGDINKFVWTRTVPLENIEKFYHRRLQVCKDCGLPQGPSDECECGSKRFKEVIQDEEEITEDIVLANGTKIPKGTKVPYFQPSNYPIIVRRNVPVNFQFGGQSDVDVIRDQQDALKKIVSTIEDKLLTGGVIIKTLDTMRLNLKNELYEVVRGNAAELQVFDVVDLQANVSQDLEFANMLYQWSQNTLGITNAFMGKEDSSAKSGVAKQQQINQSAGRIQSKVQNKYIAFKQLYQLMFEFKLAYYDELRPFLSKNENNQDDWGQFNKYEFLRQDANGDWYYNTDFTFDTNMKDSLPRDKVWLTNTLINLAKMKEIDPVSFWTIMESIDFPEATMVKEQLIEQQKQQAQQQAQQAQQQQAPPQGQGQPGQQQAQPGQQGMPNQGDIQQFITSLPQAVRQKLATLPQDEQMNIVTSMMKQPPEALQQIFAEFEGGGDQGAAPQGQVQQGPG